MPAHTQSTRRLSVQSLDDRCLPSFGVGGTVTAGPYPGASDQGVLGTALQADGKIVAVGGGVATRFNPDGTPDLTFDGDGVRSLAGYASDVVVQADGKIVVAGMIGPTSNRDFYLQRLLPEGSPDVTFGTGGVVQTAFKKGSGANDTINSIALQSDGKLVAVGSINGSLWGVARYTTAGALDPTFSGDGWLTDVFDKQMSVNELPNALGIQPDGKLVVAGTTYRPATNWDFTVVRYTTGGALDSAFGSGGKVFVDFGAEHGQAYSTDRAYAVALQADGKVVVSGSSGDFALVRLNPNGSLDPMFAGDGRLLTLPPGWARASAGTSGPAALAIQSDGAIVACWNTGGDAVVARFNADGSADTSFDGDSWKEFEYGPGPQCTSNDLFVQPDGKIVVAGGYYSTAAATMTFGLARLNPDGMFDTGP